MQILNVQGQFHHDASRRAVWRLSTDRQKANAMQKKRELMPSLSLLTLFIHQRNRLVGGHVGLNETNYIW